MKKFNYALPTTNSFYASFDHGFIWANDIDEARAKAIRQIEYDVEKVNDILDHSDNTIGFYVEVCTDELAIEETEETLIDLVIQQVRTNVFMDDTSEIAKLFKMLPVRTLIEYLTESNRKHLVD